MERLSENLVRTLSYEEDNRHKNPFLVELDKLNVGEGLRISRDEWSFKSTIQVISNLYGRKLGKKFRARVVTGTEGWVVIRSE